MANGKVSLNGVWYKTQGLPSQSLANQMASKVGQGQSKYADLTSWDAWVQQDWQEGVGRLQPFDNGGFLYGELESRVPNQLILSGLPVQVDQRDLDGSLADNRYMPNNMAGAWTISSAGANTKAASPFEANAVNAVNPGGGGWSETRERFAWVYLRADVGTQITFEVRNNNSGSPGSTVYVTRTITVTGDSKSFYWYGMKELGHASIVNGTQYWLAVFPVSGSIEVGYGSSGYATASKLLVSGTWTAQASQYMMYSMNPQRLTYETGGGTLDNSGGGFTFGKLGASTYMICPISNVFKYDAANDEWDDAAVSGNLVSGSSAVEWDGELYMANWSTAANAFSIDSAGVDADLGYQAHVFARNGGYLWRSVINIPYYTTVASPSSGDWVTSDEIKVGTADYPIVSMCGVDTNMFCATSEGLYRIAEGDFAVGVCEWSSNDGRNGIGMVNHQGTLYILANGRVMRYQEDGTLQDVWIMRDDDLVAGRLGRPRAICVVNNMVMVVANGEQEGGFPTVWAFQNESWHHIATLPYAATVSTMESNRLYAMMHDTEAGVLWVALPSGETYRLYVSETAINPYNDAATKYSPYGWIEWDWFDGPILEAQKDFHSVLVFGENFDAACTATVYWKDDASTGWETLGTIDSNNEELTWTLGSGTRPNTQRLKLAVLLKTSDATQTPRVRAIRVKYHTMVTDWFRWTMNIDVSGKAAAYQMLPDGTRHTLSASEIKNNLDALSAGYVPPFVYIDIDSKQWLVKVIDANFTYRAQEYNESTGDFWFEGIYSYVVESVQPEQYSA